MLSFIYQLASRFERKHGIGANLLYINYAHFDELKGCFDNPADIDSILMRLNMAVVLTDDAVHPRVAWSPVRARAAS